MKWAKLMHNPLDFKGRQLVHVLGQSHRFREGPEKNQAP